MTNVAHLLNNYGANGVKPRYDNGGTEFGDAHRDVGPGYLMFDVDRIYAKLEVDLSIKKENEAFVEYRRTVNGVRFIAIFEVKHHKTPFSNDALNKDNSNSIARLEMCRKLGARLFVVFATNGRQPFEFHEVNLLTGDSEMVGLLDYTPQTRAEQIKTFWRDTLKIER